MLHNQISPLAGQTLPIKGAAMQIGGEQFRVEDWADRVLGQSWKYANGNPSAMIYAMRTGLSEISIPMDDEVLYGKIGNEGCMVHVNELLLPIEA